MSTPSEKKPALVILNGPSRDLIKGLCLTIPTVGCNWAWRDFDLTDCVVIDRMTVAAIRKHLPGAELPCRMWTRLSSLELPPGWQQRPAPGIDSGSMAIDLALSLVTGPVLVVGADGMLGRDHSTAYEYRWHPQPPTPRIHQRHRSTVVELAKKNPHRILMVTDQPDPDLKTITLDQALQQLAKYRKTGNSDGQTSNLQTQ